MAGASFSVRLRSTRVRRGAEVRHVRGVPRVYGCVYGCIRGVYSVFTAVINVLPLFYTVLRSVLHRFLSFCTVFSAFVAAVAVLYLSCVSSRCFTSECVSCRCFTSECVSCAVNK